MSYSPLTGIVGCAIFVVLLVLLLINILFFIYFQKKRMKKKMIVSIVILVFFTLLLVSVGTLAFFTPRDGHASGRIRVIFKPGVTLDEINETVDSLGYEIGSYSYFDITDLNMIDVRVPDGEEKEAVDRFKELDNVENASLYFMD